MANLIATVIAALVVAAAAIPILAADAYAASRLWGMFAVPLGVSSIGFWHAFGLKLMLNVMHPSKFDVTKDDSPAKSAGELALTWVIRVTAPLLVVWLGGQVAGCM